MSSFVIVVDGFSILFVSNGSIEKISTFICIFISFETYNRLSQKTNLLIKLMVMDVTTVA